MKFRVYRGQMERCDILLKCWTFRGFHGNSIFVLITCSEAVLDLETDSLQLIIAEEADPHEASTGEDEPRTGRATEAADERREAEGTVPHLDVVETTLKGSLDVEVLVKQQFYPLTGQSWGKQSEAVNSRTESDHMQLSFVSAAAFQRDLTPCFVEGEVILVWSSGCLLRHTFQNIQAFLVGRVGIRVVWRAEAATISISQPVSTVKGPLGPHRGFEHLRSGTFIWLDVTTIRKKGKYHCNSSYGRKKW